jgi:mRNA interferase MazF
VVAAAPVGRGDVYFVDLAPGVANDARKMRPCVVVSPDELNEHLPTYTVAPLTTGDHPYPFRVPCRFQDRQAYVVLDQLRMVGREQLVRRIGTLGPATMEQVLKTLQEMFAP